MRRIGTALVLALAACGGAAPPAKPVVGPPIDERTAEKDAKGTVREIYGAISRGKPDNLFSVLDDKVIVFGPRGKDALATRTDALVALRAFLDPGADEHVRVSSGKLDVTVSPGGRSAWAFDLVDVEGMPMAVTAILSSEDDFFRVTTAALARTPSTSELRAELTKVAVVPPGAAAAGSIDDAARGAVERFEQGLRDPQTWGEDLASRSAAVVVGPARGELARGKKQIQKLWKKRVDAGTRAATSGGITAGTTADGQLAWVTAPVTRVDNTDEPLPLRMFAVFEKHDGTWKMVALHEALAIDEPGAGASFVKVLPPAAPAPESPPEAKDDDKPKSKAKRPRKKKRGKR